MNESRYAVLGVAGFPIVDADRRGEGRFMLELVNFAAVSDEVETLLGGDKAKLVNFLARHDLDGLELFLYDAWDEQMFPASIVHGVHLRFWPAWVSFWRQNVADMARDYGDDAAIVKRFGSLSVEDWVAVWRENIRSAVAAGAQYLVLHVSETPLCELAARPFTTITDEEVIDAALELVAALAEEIPADCRLLFENLWWPGLTFRRPDLAERLVSRSKHQNCGFMLDTGHLMCTNLHLKSEAEGVAFILSVYAALGSLREKVYGLHLHQSLSGAYVRAMAEAHRDERWPREADAIMDYIARVDWHNPFTAAAVRRIVDAVRPEYLVHEFLPASFCEWEEKVLTQRRALGWA